MDAAILGLGTATPRHMVDQTVAAEIAKGYSCETPAQARLLPTLYRRTGVRTRGSAVVEHYDGKTVQQSFFPPWRGGDHLGPTTGARSERFAADAAPLARQAAAAALLDAHCPAAEITHVVTVSCTGFFAPGVDVALIRQLGLASTVERTHVGFMGCHGALNGLRVASAFARSDPHARVLLCAIELCSLHYRYGWDPEKVVANALFADGAAAAVIASAPGAAPADGAAAVWRIGAGGSCLLPDSEHEMTWKIGDHGFEMTLSPRVPGVIEQHLRPWLERWLGARGLSLQQIGSWAVHPGGPRIVDSVACALSLPEGSTSISDEVLRDFGNMSSPTVLFILQRLRQRGAPLPCVALAFGPGLMAEAALLVR